jgi:hypothetical protein
MLLASACDDGYASADAQVRRAAHVKARITFEDCKRIERSGARRRSRAS